MFDTFFLDEMESEFGSYVDRTLRRFNKTWAEADFMSLANDGDASHQHIVEIELDPLRTRKRIKTPLLTQDTGDIHKTSVVRRHPPSSLQNACNRCLLRFPCIMVSICILLGMAVLAYLIFILPSCGALLRNPKCILWRPRQPATSTSSTSSIYSNTNLAFTNSI